MNLNKKILCLRGHDTSITGREKSGKCRQCGRDQKALWRKAHPKVVKERWEKWANENKEKIKDSKLKRLYGLSVKSYKLLLLRQSKRCAICNRHENFVYRGKLDIDHCHKTGKVRGLLCSSCNNILGRCKDSIHVLKMAIKYLNKNEKVKTY